MRQPSGHQHDAGRAERFCLINRAAIIIARLGAMRGIRCEHAAAAIARQIEPGVAHRARRAVEPDRRDMVAPGIDGADAMPRAGVDDLK